MKKFLIGVAAVICLFAVSCSASGEKPFSGITADDIESFSVSCMPPGKTVSTDDEENIEELSEILNKVVVYDEDPTEYAGQSVVFTIEKTDGTTLKVNSYSPQIIIDGVKYLAKSSSCKLLSDFGSELSEALPSVNKSFEDIKSLLSGFPSDYDGVLKSSCCAVSNGTIINGQDLFDDFADSVDTGLADDIVIASFTAEGDPIYTYVYFDGSVFSCAVDSTRDRYGSDSDGYKTYEYKYMLTSGTEAVSYIFLSNDPSAVYSTGQSPDDGGPLLLFELNAETENV